MFNTKYLSIDIGNKNIKYLVGKEQGNNVSIEKIGIIPTPVASVNDGKLIDINLLKDVIGNKLQHDNIKVKKVICTVESTSIITREMNLPLAEVEEMESMIRYEVEQYLPIVLNDYVVEHKILDEYIEDGVKKARLLVAALPKSIAESYLDLIRALNLKPYALNMNSNAASKIFNKKIKINKSDFNLENTAALIDLGHSFININIISKGISQFNRLIKSGSKDIDINIANLFNLSLDEAEERKIRDCRLVEDTSSTPTQEMLTTSVKTVLDQWIQEVNKIFQYYNTRITGNRIDQIYLYGGASRMSGLSHYLESELNIPVISVEHLSNLKLSKDIVDIETEKYLSVIGAIIENR